MAALIMNNKDLLYVIKPEEQNESTLRELLTLHPEIQFVSLMGVDFAGNDTDEKNPDEDFPRGYRWLFGRQRGTD